MRFRLFSNLSTWAFGCCSGSRFQPMALWNLFFLSMLCFLNSALFRFSRDCISFLLSLNVNIFPLIFVFHFKFSLFILAGCLFLAFSFTFILSSGRWPFCGHFRSLAIVVSGPLGPFFFFSCFDYLRILSTCWPLSGGFDFLLIFVIPVFTLIL